MKKVLLLVTLFVLVGGPAFAQHDDKDKEDRKKDNDSYLQQQVTSLQASLANLKAEIKLLGGGPKVAAVYVFGAAGGTSDSSVASATSFGDSGTLHDVSTVTFLPGVFDPSKPLPRFFCQIYQVTNVGIFAQTLHILNVQTNVVDGSITVTVAIASGGTFGNQGTPLPPGFMSENYSIVGIQ